MKSSQFAVARSVLGSGASLESVSRSNASVQTHPHFDRFVVVGSSAEKKEKPAASGNLADLETDTAAISEEERSVTSNILPTSDLKVPSFVKGRLATPTILKGKQGTLAMTRIEVTPRVKQWFRFSSDQNFTVTVADLFSICGGIVTIANTQVRNWAGSVRLRKVRIWSSSGTSTVSASGLHWNSTGTNAQRQPDFVYDQSMPTGLLTGQVCEYRPPKTSLAGYWFTSSYTPMTDPVFSIVVNGGRIMCDVLMDFTLGNTLALLSLTIGTTHALGTVGYSALDQHGSIVAPTILLPNWA